MAIITDQGITPETLTDYVNKLNAVFVTVFGSEINLDPETPQGQLIGEIALSFAQIDESIVDTVNASNINKAIGQQMDALMSFLQIFRRPASATEVDVQLAGVPLTFIPSGTKARDTQGNQYALQNNIILDNTGNGNGVMVCTVTGPIPALANTLNQIVDVVPGWETVNNADAGETGVNQEMDYQYFSRYQQSVKINALTPAGAIKAQLLEIATMQQAEVEENDTKEPLFVNGVTLLPNSVCVVVVGGTDQEVGTAIGIKKTIGCDTNGTSSYTYTDPSTTVPKLIRFYRAESVPIQIQINIEIDSTFPANGLDGMKNNLVNYFANQRIGQNVIYTRLFTPINQIQGHEITSLQIAPLDGTLGNADIPISLTELATLDANNIDILVAT